MDREHLALFAGLGRQLEYESGLADKHFGKGYILAQQGLLQLRLAILALLDSEDGDGPLLAKDVAERLRLGDGLANEMLALMAAEGFVACPAGTLWVARVTPVGQEA